MVLMFSAPCDVNLHHTWTLFIPGMENGLFDERKLSEAPVVVGAPRDDVEMVDIILHERFCSARPFDEFFPELVRGQYMKESVQDSIKRTCLKYRSDPSNQANLVRMTDDELKSLLLYTYEANIKDSNIYKNFNLSLSERRSYFAGFFDDFMYHLLAGLRKLPLSKQSVVFRGIREKLPPETYAVNSLRMWLPFSSTSYSLKNALLFAKKGTLFIIVGEYWGYDIDGISYIKSEREVLLEPCSFFKVLFNHAGDENKPDVIVLEMMKDYRVAEERLPPAPSQRSQGRAMLTYPRDKEKIETITRAVAFADGKAMMDVGAMLENGDGVLENRELAMYFYNEAKRAGVPEGEERARICDQYFKRQAFENAMKYAVGGDWNNQYKVGDMYLRGVGVEQSFTEAERWISLAMETAKNFDASSPLRAARCGMDAEKGDAEGQYNLGMCYYNGYGLPKDFDQAALWLEKASEQGHLAAKALLAQCFINGRGVKQSFVKAKKLLEEAKALGFVSAFTDSTLEAACHGIRAEEGDVEGQYNLALCYSMGRGVSRSSNRAYELFKIAAANGHEGAKTQLRRFQ